jgi:hypothetical protein
MFKTFVILRRIQRDIFINVRTRPVEMHAEGQTDGQTNNRFAQFCKRALKMLKNLQTSFVVAERVEL